jgi:ADP-ribosylglycohydrolase
MRVAPLGAYHPDRPNTAAEEAITSAQVTHAHPEGIAGAVLVAATAAYAAARLDANRLKSATSAALLA